MKSEIESLEASVRERTAELTRKNEELEREITERKQATEALRESEERFRNLMEFVPGVSIQGYDLKGTVLYWNKASEEVYGYTAEEALGQNLGDLIIPDDIMPLFEKALKTGKYIEKSGEFAPPGEVDLLHKGGHLVPVYSIHTAVKLPGKHPILFCIDVDLSDRKNKEEALRENEEKLRNIFEHSTNVYYSHTPDHIPTYLSPQIKDIIGYEVDEALIKWTELVSDNPINEKGFELTLKAIETGKPQPSYELELFHKNGRKIWVEVRESPVVVDGKTVSIVGALNDITKRKQAEETLKENEDRYRQIYQFSPDSIIIHDMDMNILDANNKTVEKFGYSKKELLEMKVFELHPEIELKHSAQVLADVMKKDMLSIETKFVRKDSSVFLAETTPCKYTLGNKQIIHVVIRDITERKQAEEALRDSEEKYRSLIENIEDIVYYTDTAGKIVHISPQVSLYGYISEEIMTKGSFIEIIFPEDVERVIAEFEHKMTTGEEIPCEFRVLDSWGKVHWVEDRSRIVRDASGSIIGNSGVLREITDRKLADEALRMSEERFDQVAKTSREIIWEVDHNGLYTHVSAVVEEVLGYKADEIVGKKHFYDLHPVEGRDALKSVALEVFKKKQSFINLENLAQTKDGRIVVLSTNGLPILDSNGELLGYRGADSDITERKQAEEERKKAYEDQKNSRIAALSLADDLTVEITERKQAEKLQDSLYRISQAVESSESIDDLYKAVHDIIKDVMTADNFFIALCDEENELLSFPYFTDEKGVTLLPRKFGRGITEYVVRTSESQLCYKEDQKELERCGEVEIFGDLSEIWLGVPLIIEGKTIGVMVVQDYSDSSAIGEREKEIIEFVSTQVAKAIEHKRAEENLQKGEDKLSGIIKSIPDYMSIIDEDYNIVWANEVVMDSFGVDVTEKKCYEVYHRFDKPCKHCIIQEVFADGKVHSHEAKTIDKDGNTIYQLSLVSTASRYADGRPKTAIEISRDITEQKSLEDQFRQSQKMESVGRLAGGVAHDFNNLLTVISGYADVALRSLNKRDPLYDKITTIQDSALSAADLTRQLLAFSRKQTLEPKVLDLNRIISTLDKMLRRLIGENIDYKTIPAKGLWQVNADPGQVEQVIVNLVVNARDAMQKGGRLTLETLNVTLSEEYARDHIEVVPGEYVMIAVSDTGCGMSKEVKKQIYEPFFTTKEVGKGTGLGLSTVFGIVKQSNGHIYVYSEEGTGTTFKFYLPRVEAKAGKIDRKAEIDEIPQGSETILVVEDQEAVREYTRYILEMQGYTVLEAIDGNDAYDICRKLDKQVDLVLTDVVMPNMSGEELVEKLCELWSDLKVVYMSGYTKNAIVHNGVLEHGTSFIQKPFHPKEIAVKVRQALDGG
ncbi:MAG: PAS domain S-box protein [Candidatus Hatepunaea meridiana]|nr:PAS domain S-box protein [Candidatus Hatepunaea meridiana]